MLRARKTKGPGCGRAADRQALMRSGVDRMYVVRLDEALGVARLLEEEVVEGVYEHVGVRLGDGPLFRSRVVAKPCVRITADEVRQLKLHYYGVDARPATVAAEHGANDASNADPLNTSFGDMGLDEHADGGINSVFFSENSVWH